MMNKQKIFTATGIALSLAIAIGGWALTSTLIDMKSEALLSVSGVTWINAPDARPTVTPKPNITEDDPAPSNDLLTITEHDIVSILQNWESPGREIPHEPTAEQISMEEAILIGEMALAAFDSKGIIPAERFTVDKTKTNAYLCQNIPHSSNESLLAPIYSYWTVVFKGEGLGDGSATIIMNAVTGKIWDMDLQINQYPYVAVKLGVDDAENILAYFMADIGISSNAEVNVVYNASSSPPSIIASQEFADGGVYAIVNINGRRLPTEQNKVTLIGAHIYLSTQVP